MATGSTTSSFSVADGVPTAQGADVLSIVGIRRQGQPRVSLDQRLERAGLAIASHIFTAYEETATKDDGLSAHAGTMVAILATLAAEAALQAAEVAARDALVTRPDGWVLGGPADGLLFRFGKAYAGAHAIGRSIWDLVADAGQAVGVPMPTNSDLERIVARAEAHLGMKPCPIISVAPAFRPLALLRPAAARHRHETAALAAEEGIYTSPEIALAYGAAIAQVIRHEPDADVLALLAAETLIGAARLVPLPYAFN